MNEPRVLLLSAIHSGHAQHSGYPRLANFIAESEFITAPRREASGGLALLVARIARRFSFSRWYIAGCIELERKAYRRLRAGFKGVVHSLWADHDLGFLDWFLQPGQKLCGTFHQCDDTLPETIQFPRRLRRFAAIVLMSETQRRFFLERGVAPERIHVVLHGVDTEFYRPEPSARNEQFTVLSVGGFRRNFPLLRQLCVRLPATGFVVLAPPAFQEMFAPLPNVRFASGLPDAELLAAYRSSSCLIHTAENATANNALLEGLACGLPVVAERVGGIPEYVDESCALLSARGDVDDMVRSIERLQGSEELRCRLSAGARARAQSLSWPKVAARMEEIYRGL